MSNGPQVKMAQDDKKDTSRRDWRDMFAVPPVIKQVFSKFPLHTYESNTLPSRSPKNRNEHTLYLWTTPQDAAQGNASFNPTCLKWQTYLNFQGVKFRTRPSNNHASPTGSLPFLLPASSSSQVPSSSSSPVPSSRLETWSHTANSKLPETSARQDIYTSLLDHAIRRAWLYMLYLDSDNFDHVARRLYLEPESNSPFVRLAVSRQLRNAARQELLKTTPRVSAQHIIDEASAAFAALSTLLGDGNWFFGQSAPGLFDAAVFAYTHLLLDDSLAWKNNPLAEELSCRQNLLQHRERILRSYYFAQ